MINFTLDTEKDYVDVDDDVTLGLTDEISLGAWVYPEDVSRWSYIAAKPHTGASAPWLVYGLRVHSDTGRFSFSLASGGTQYSVVADSTANIGQWYHVVGTYSSSTNDMKIYIDGELSNTVNVVAGAIDTNNQPLQIGRHQFQTTTLFNGAIDDVRIYNRTLTAQEVKELYQEDSKIIKIVVNGNTGLYECARFYVPRGSIGVVRQLWQWLELKNPPATPPVVSTPFDALGHTRDTGQNPIDIHWKFRLFHGKRRGPLYVGASGNLPKGWGYPRFSGCRELRFPWGSDAPVFLLVPEHHTFIAYGDILLGKNRNHFIA